MNYDTVAGVWEESCPDDEFEKQFSGPEEKIPINVYCESGSYAHGAHICPLGGTVTIYTREWNDYPIVVFRFEVEGHYCARLAEKMIGGGWKIDFSLPPAHGIYKVRYGADACSITIEDYDDLHSMVHLLRKSTDFNAVIIS